MISRRTDSSVFERMLSDVAPRSTCSPSPATAGSEIGQFVAVFCGAWSAAHFILDVNGYFE